MKTIFSMGFQRPMLGQFDWIPAIVSAGLQAGATVYGAQMQQNIAKMQKRTQEDIANKQAAAQQAQAQAQQQQIIQQQQADALAPKIMGIDQGTFIIGGVALALAVGVIAIVSSKSSSTPVQTAVSA